MLPGSNIQSSQGNPPATSVTGISPVFDSLEAGAGAAPASAPRSHEPRRGEKRRLSDEGRPGKLPPGVHAYMVSRLLAWTEQHPGALL